MTVPKDDPEGRALVQAILDRKAAALAFRAAERMTAAKGIESFEWTSGEWELMPWQESYMRQMFGTDWAYSLRQLRHGTKLAVKLWDARSELLWRLNECIRGRAPGKPLNWPGINEAGQGSAENGPEPLRGHRARDRKTTFKFR